MSFSCRDRTLEFFSTADVIRQQLNAQTQSQRPQETAIVPASRNKTGHSNFAEAAKEVGNGLQHVGLKLQDLTKLARETSLFRDPAAEIQQLTCIIKEDLGTLSNDITLLEEFVNKSARGSWSSSTPHQQQQHSQQVVSNLKNQLASTAKNFAQVLSMRTKNLKDQSNRRKQFSSTHTLPLRKRVSPLGSALPAPHDMGSPDAPAPQQTPQQQQFQLQMQQEEGDEYLAQRAAAVEEIERTIHELAEMYTRLAQIVQIQNEVAVRIDENVEQTLTHMTSAHQELTNYYSWLSGSRWLMVKVFAFLIIFAIFFIVFVA